MGLWQRRNVAATYVNGSSGCRRWIIGNEPNLSREWPDHQPIYPWNYAACYKLCRQAIHALPGHQQDEVLIAASGPWNAELKYNSNKDGDWITYFTDVIGLCGAACDGYAIHAYTHGYDVSLVTSSARMDRPFQDRFYEFYTYRDYCEAIPPDLRRLPVYLTEANGNGPWQAVRLMPAMLQEIDTWNHSKLPKISSVIFYRYPRYDQFYIEGRGEVIAEYQNAVALGYESPMLPTTTPPTPQPEPPTPAPEPEPLEWDNRLSERGCVLQPAIVAAGTSAQRVKVGRWFDKQQAQNRINIFVRLLDGNGQLAIGVPVTQFWSTGSATKPTERKADPWLAAQGLGAEYSLDFPMNEVAPSYGIRIEGDYPADIVNGCGLGSIEQPDYKIHTAYFFEWQLSSAGYSPPDSTPPVPLPRAELIWPVVGPVTQRWGENPDFYQKTLGIPYHNGVDIGVPVGTPVIAAGDGIVKWLGDEGTKGYGLYCRIYFPAARVHIVTAHLDSCSVQVGATVKRGQVIALSGNSGLSSGPHTHIETRLGTENAYAQGTFGSTNGRVDPQAVYWALGGTQEPVAGPGR